MSKPSKTTAEAGFRGSVIRALQPCSLLFPQTSQPTEACCLHHHEAVCDQDQEAGEPPKSLKG